MPKLVLCEYLSVVVKIHAYWYHARAKDTLYGTSLEKKDPRFVYSVL
jgi:hypothetical protein